MKVRNCRRSLVTIVAISLLFVVGPLVSCSSDEAGDSDIRRTVSPQAAPKSGEAPKTVKPKSNVVPYRIHDPVWI